MGTYPLPMAQLDRFLFKISMTHIDRDSELRVLATWGQPSALATLPTVTRGEVVTARRMLRSAISVSPLVHECLVDIAQRLRDDKRTRWGVSTRSLVQAISALQTSALLCGRDFVSSEDIVRLAKPLFSHRLDLAPGVPSVDAVVNDALAQPLETLSRATLRTP
jgi:MoxR-like ATPase